MDPISLEEALPAGDLKDTLSAYGIKDIGQLAKQYADTRKAYDSSIRYPGQDAPQAELKKYFQKIGAAETAESYPLPPELGQSRLGKTLEMMRGIAAQSGVPVDTWQKLAEEAKTADNNLEQERRREIDALKAQWDAKAAETFGDKLESMRANGQRILNQISAEDQELKEILHQTGLERHPKMLELVAKVGELTSGEQTATTGLEATTMSSPLDEALELKRKVMAFFNSEEYRQKNHPGHEAAIREFYGWEKRLAELKYDGATDPRLNEQNIA